LRDEQRTRTGESDERACGEVSVQHESSLSYRKGSIGDEELCNMDATILRRMIGAQCANHWLRDDEQSDRMCS
jgi:hypothetical protein